MAINLKQISTSDSDNIKLDKVNYNFDQLVANGGGPQGPIGPKGDTGFQGVMGPRGFQGTLGSQGVQGPAGANTESYWKRILGDNNSLTTDTLFPDAATGSLNPPVISIGFLSTDAEYNTHQPLNNDQSPYQWIINRKDHFYSNLRFKSSDVTDNYFDFRINYDQPSNKTTFTFSFKELQQTILTRINWNADNHIFKSNVTGSNILSVSSNLITFDRDAHFNSPVKINSELYIENAQAGVNKIATSLDPTGKVVFKSIKDLGGTVPYGTIISILPSVFTDVTRFINAQTIDLNQLPNTMNDALKIKVGAGIGDYDGWYLCNGQTWIGEINQSQHLVPDLNSFAYTIPDNVGSTDPNSQGTAGETNSNINIVGGADILMEADVVTPGAYSINQTIQTTDVNFNTAGTTTFKIKKLPQIIYLGESDMYWSDKGSGQAPTTSLNFQLVDANINTPNLGTSSLGSAVYSQGGSYIHTVQVSAPVGYYWSSFAATVATQPSNGFIDAVIATVPSGVNPTTITLDIYVDIQPPNGSTAIIGINTIGMFTVLPVSTVQYSHPIWYPSVDVVTNGTVSQLYDLGTDPTNIPVLTLGTISAATGSIRYLKYRITANSGYAFSDPTLTGFSLYTAISGSGTITEYSVTDVYGDGTLIDYIVRDNDFGFYNPGGYTDSYMTINATASSINSGVQLTNISGQYPASNDGSNLSGVIQNYTGTTIYLKLGAVTFYGNSPTGLTTVNPYGDALSLTTATSAVTYSSNSVVMYVGTNLPISISYESGATSGYSAQFYWSYNSNGPFSPVLY